jgi:homoserine O-acetyltransferase
MTAHITYLSEQSMHKKFGRHLQDNAGYGYGFDTEFSVESYLKHQGTAFAGRFDPNSYLYITRAIDYYDLTGNGSLADGLADTAAAFLIMSVSSDWLYPPHLSEEVVAALHGLGKDVQYRKIMSDYGHDGFLLEDSQMNYHIGRFLTPRLVSDLMTGGPPVIREDTTISKAAEIMIEQEVNHLPVVTASGALCGIVTSWDIAKAVAGGFSCLADIMTADVVFVRPEDLLRDAAGRMEQHHVSGLPVVDADRAVVGILTSEMLTNMIGKD